MAVEIAAAYVSLIPSFRGGQAAIAREMNGPMNTAGTQAAKQFSASFLPGLVNVGKRTAQALGLGAVAAAGFGVKTAAAFQQTTVAYEGMLGSASKAKDLLKDLQGFAAVTPFNFTNLADIGRQLLATGVGAKDIIPTLTTLGDTASNLGLGQDQIKGVVRAMGQMRGKGHAYAEEMQQIAESFAGFPAYDALAAQLGITVPQLFARMKDGAVPAEVAIQGLLAGMKEVPGAAGAMDRQSKTLNGRLSNLQDTLTKTAIDFITPYLPAISTGVEKFSDFLTKTMLPALTKVGDWIVQHQPVMEGLAIMVGSTLVIAFGAWAASVIAATWPILLAGVVIGALGAAFLYCYQQIPAFHIAVLIAVDLVKTLFGWVMKAVDALGKLASALNLGGVLGVIGHGLGLAPGKAKTDPNAGVRKAGASASATKLVSGFLSKLPVADSGGIWPGPKGVHSLGWVAGGETILPTHNGSVGIGGPIVVSAAPGADNAMVGAFLAHMRFNKGSARTLVSLGSG